MKMYIIRHGQTPWNARKCLQGRSDVDLNENGIYLAELTGKALRDVTFDMAFTSPLIRAKHIMNHPLWIRLFLEGMKSGL